MSILKIFSYFGILDTFDGIILIADIDLLLSEFLVAFIIVNLLAIAYAQYYVKKWLEFEKVVPDRLKIYRDFERMFIEQQQGSLSSSAKKEFEKKREIIKYIILRQEFLSPTFTPIVKESAFRDDFNFAGYLSKCLYKTIGDAISMSFSTLLAFFFFIGFYVLIRCVVPGDNSTDIDKTSYVEIYIMGGLALLIFILQSAIRIKTHRIYGMLSHPLKTPYEFTINPFDAVRNPHSNLDKIVVPKYLRDNFASASVSKRRVINSHEALFWLSSPKYMVKLLHFSLFVQLIWPIIFFSNYCDELDTPFPIIVCVISTLLIF